MGRRTSQAWLTNASEWAACRPNPPAINQVVPTTTCEQADALLTPKASCRDRDLLQYAQVLQRLHTSPQCLDDAIGALNTRFARAESDGYSNLAAAYLMRAQRDDDPVDYLRAAGAADQAIASNRNLPAAWFNRALAFEALGLTADAINSWNRVTTLDKSRWADEARAHSARLTALQENNDEVRWKRNRSALALALSAGDRKTVAALIEPFPLAAERYFEEELLPQCAATPSADELARLHLFASVLSARWNGDKFATDVVAAIDRAAGSPKKLDALRQGHLAFQTARQQERDFAFALAAIGYRKAIALLQRGGSPFHLRAAQGLHSADRSFPPPALAAVAHYPYLRARLLSLHGFATQQTDYLRSLKYYADARTAYTNLRAYEPLTATHSRLAGGLLKVGHNEFAWREAFYALQHQSHLMEWKDRHALSTEVVSAALALGHPNVALRHQNLVLLRLPKNAPATHFAVAFRQRAEIEVELQQWQRAAVDLDQAERFNATAHDTEVRTALNARFEEVAGRQLLPTNPRKAFQSFTTALENTDPENDTILAAILTRRAEASVMLGQREAARKDLRAALDHLRHEQVKMLEDSDRDKSDDLWPAYFARFQETSHLLIQLLMDDDRAIEALEVAEQTRAVEPLDLIRHNNDQELKSNSVAEIRKALPAGTFLIEYASLPDRTYVWILSRDSFKSRRLKADAAMIRRWNDDLRNALKKDRYRAATDIRTPLTAAYDSLAAEVVGILRELPGGESPERLVFVPDGAMHGLPIHAFALPGPDNYLTDVAPIEISGSAALYLVALENNRRRPPRENPSVLAIGNPAFDPDFPLAKSLRPLRYAECEAKAICNLYQSCLPLLGPEGTVQAFFDKARDRDVIDVAAHALVNARKPSRSLILLAQSGEHPGALDAETIREQLKLEQARLVVLATCSSVGGLPVGPEGVAPLARSVLATGVPAVIGSLWDVGDATTAAFMVSFHRHYQASGDAALAMQQARRNPLLKNNNRPDPQSVLIWAPFQVVGHTAPPPGAHFQNHGVKDNGVPASHPLQWFDRVCP